MSFGPDGFLAEPRDDGLFPLNTHLVELTGLDDVPCVVLLGEPGLGKSFVLKEEEQRLRGCGVDATRVDLGETVSDGALRARILEDSAWQKATNGDGPVHLLLDSLDEARVQSQGVTRAVLRVLAEVDASRLRLRLTCRFAEWPAKLEGGLIDLFGESGVKVLELLPLRKADVRVAAEANGLEADAFLAQVVEREAQPLAASPLTLTLLMGLAGTEAGLPRTQIDLYRRGCLLLAGEHDDDRRDGPIGRQSLPRERLLGVAARIAAATLLSGCVAVRVRNSNAEVEEPGIATVDDLAGGDEREVGVAVPTPFPVDVSAVQEAARSALFSGRGEGRVGWAHQTYGEFLCALYLSSRGFNAVQVRSLTMTSHGGAWRVVPQLGEVVSWLAVMDPAFFEEVLAADPDVLLGTSCADFGDEARARLVEALLSGAARGRIPQYGFSRRRLARLRHPDLAGQLERVIGDRRRPVDERRLAIEIAEAVGLG